MALIKHAINQGRDCVDNIANRVKAMGAARSVPNVVDVLVVGPVLRESALHYEPSRTSSVT